MKLFLLLVLFFTTPALKAVTGLTITINNANGTKPFQYEDDDAELQGRSYFLPESVDSRLVGHLVRPGLGNELCKSIAAVNVNLSLIAYVDDTYGMCPEIIEENIYNAGYAAMIVYTSNRRISLDPATNINLPQAMFSDIKFKDMLECEFGPNFTYTDKLYVEMWDDSSARLQRLFIIFGCVLLVAVLLAVALFCGTFVCRVAIRKWRTRGLTRWQVRRLPRRKFHKAKETTETCSICLEDFKEGSTIRVLPCEHIYHPKCVDEWLQKWKRTCPLCKSTIKRSKGARIDPDEASGLLSEGASSARASFNNEPDYGATDTTHLLEPVSTAGSAGSPSDVEMGQSVQSPDSERTFHTPAPMSDGDTLSYQTADEGQ